MAQKQIFSLLLVGCLAALALANPLPEEHPAVPAPTGPATDPLYQNLARQSASQEGKKDKRSAEEATKEGSSVPKPVAQVPEGKKEKPRLGTEERKADNVTKEFEELVSLLANPFSPNLAAKKEKPNETPKREAEEAKPNTKAANTGSTQPIAPKPVAPASEGKKEKREAEEVKPKAETVKTAYSQPIAPKPVTETKKEKREAEPEAAELVKSKEGAEVAKSTEGAEGAKSTEGAEVAKSTEGAQLVKSLRVCDQDGKPSSSEDDDPSTVDEVFESADGCQDQLRELKGDTPRVEGHSDAPASHEEEKKEKRSVEEQTGDFEYDDEEYNTTKRSVEEETPRVAAKDVPQEKKEKRSAEEKPVVATKPAPKDEEHKEKRSAEEKPVVATKPAPKDEEHKEKRSTEEKPVVATKPAPKEEAHKEKRSTEEKPVVTTKPAPKEEEHKEKRSTEEKPVVATKPAPKEEEHKEKRSAEEKPSEGTKEVKSPQEKRERRGLNEQKPEIAKDIPVPREVGKKEKRYVDTVRAEKQTVPALKSQAPGELEKKVEKRNAETSSVIKGAAFEDKPWEVKPYVTSAPTTTKPSVKE